MRIGIDFDEVIANSIVAIIKLHNERYGTNFTLEDVTTYKFENLWGGTTEEAIKKVDEFFREDQIEMIKPLEGAVEGITELKKKGHDLWVITGRSQNDVPQTERWLKHHFPDVFKGAHYANFYTLDKDAKPKKKVDICRELGIEVMIDDNLKTALECSAEGIRVLLMDQVWNHKGLLPAGVQRVFSWKEIVREL